jgi:hypothetical protein
MDDLGMQMADYQETCIMTAKFNDLNKKIDILGHVGGGNNTSTESLILNTWKRFPNCFQTITRLKPVVLSLFGTTNSCE